MPCAWGDRTSSARHTCSQIQHAQLLFLALVLASLCRYPRLPPCFHLRQPLLLPGAHVKPPPGERNGVEDDDAEYERGLTVPL